MPPRSTPPSSTSSVPRAWHNVEQYANGHAFMQNLRRGQYKFAIDFPPVPLAARPAMASDWQHADAVELVDGYDLADADGVNTTTLSDVDVAFQGGFLHIRRPGDDLVQTVSAPAVLRIRQSAGTTL